MQKTVLSLPFGIGRLLKAAVLLCIAFPIVLGLFYVKYLKPNANEQWVYPLHIASFNIPISPPKAVWLASSAYIGPWLDGIEKQSPYGLLKLQWDNTQNQLSINCDPCQIQHKSIGVVPLDLKAIKVTAQRQTEKPQGLEGDIFITNNSNSTESLQWSAQVEATTPTDLYLYGQPSLAFIYSLFKPDILELKTAQLTGTLGIKTHLTLADLKLNVQQIELQGVSIKGLPMALPSLTVGGTQTTTLPMNHWVIRAVLAAEDQRFEQHPGYDLTEIKRALNVSLFQKEPLRGASTISQQLAKLIYTGGEKSLTRKLRELLYAIEIEKKFSKEQIINLYINHAPWGVDEKGQIICGVQAAAQHFFKVDAKDVEPLQAIWLAAMLHAPVKETRNWIKTGKINLNRAIWVASNVRHAPKSTPEERKVLIQTLKDDPSLGAQLP